MPGLMFVFFMLPGLMLLIFIVIQFFFRGKTEMNAAQWRKDGRCEQCGNAPEFNDGGYCPKCGTHQQKPKDPSP